MEHKLPVGLVLEQPLDNASGEDRPGSLDFPAHILKANGNESGVPSKLMVLRCRSDSAQPSLATNRFQQESPLPETRGFPAKPCADDKPAARFENSGHLGEECLEVGHMLRTLDRDHAIEGSRLEPVGQPVAKEINRVGRVGFKAQGISILGL